MDVFAQLAGTCEALAAAEARAEEWKAAFGIKHGLDDPEVAAEYVKALIENEGEAQARAEKYREAILSALDTSTMGAINYHFGPNARVAVSRESIAQYERIAALRDMALPDPRQERDAGAEG